MERSTVQSCLAAPFFRILQSVIVRPAPAFRLRAPDRDDRAILSEDLRAACASKIPSHPSRVSNKIKPPHLRRRCPSLCVCECRLDAATAVQPPHEEKFTFVEKCAELLVIVL